MNISAIGKYLDQPLLISRIKNQTPKILAVSAFAFGLYDTMQAKPEERKKRCLKNAIILFSVGAVSLISAFGLRIRGKQLFKGLVSLPDEKEILKNNTLAVDTFLKRNTVDKEVSKTLNKAKTGLLGFKDTKKLLNSRLQDADGGKTLMDTLFSKKDDLSAKEIFEETGRLSFLGFAPVAAGVVGGILADKAAGESTRERNLNKIKEGTYQFLANIFMCNVGAAGALFGAERLQKAGIIKNLGPAKKLAVIMAGIFATGIVGGSYAANFIAKKVIDPVFGKEKCPKTKPNKGFSAERTPEPLDMALHTDDIATAGVLSGFRWIEPMLPLMYTISGYRAGIGYRNGEKPHC